MTEKPKGASQRQEQHQLDDLAHLALIPVLAGGGVYGLFEFAKALGMEVGDTVAIAGFTALLTGIAVNALKESANRREEKRRWEEQRDLLRDIRDRLRMK